jgi:PAS domain S-box-containing protein
MTQDQNETCINNEEVLCMTVEKYKLLIEKSLTGIFVYRDETILFTNPRFSDILQYVPENVVGHSIWELFYDEDIPTVRSLVMQRKTDPFADLHYECRLVRADKGVIWADIASSVMANYEGETAVLVNFYDITEKREAEAKRLEILELAKQQEEQLVHSTRLAELGEMAAAISHELNQPLTGIRNFARNAYYMLEQHVGTEDDIKENLRLISEQVDRASKIIRRMRELARQSERLFAPVDINSIIRESVDFLMPQMTLSGVEVSLALSPDIPETIGDRIQLEQVFLNLLTNARQAMEEVEERHLIVRTDVDSDPACTIVIEIQDTGKGFAPEETERLFRPFFTTKKTGHGTGLGLSISLGIIRDHQGTITAVGKPGNGATFTICLPVTEPEIEH